jgi:hypothetical protein
MNRRMRTCTVGARRVLLLCALAATASASEAQQGLGRCTEPMVSGAPARGEAAPVHPDRLREMYAPAIVARDWPTAITGYSGTVRLTLEGFASPSPAFAAARGSILSLQDSARIAMLDWIARPVDDRLGVLSGDVVNQFRPVLVRGGTLAILQSSTRPFGVALDTTAMSDAEVEALCWSSWSLYRLAGSVNYETVPAALARVEAQTRRWERYQTRGPLQLPHELVANRLIRDISSRSQFHPPSVGVVVAHPFAGIELRRAGNGIARTETIALEVLGATWWFNDWKHFAGASWVVSSTSEGDLGHGALARVGGIATAGFVQRQDASGGTSRVLLVHLDALRLLASDNNARRVLALLGVSGEALYGEK